MVAVADSASAQTETCVSSLVELLNTTSPVEPITASASPGTVPHETTDGSSSSFPFSCEKLVADAAKSAYAQTLQESDGSSLHEFLDSSPKELITSGRQAEQQSPIDASPIASLLRCEKQVAVPKQCRITPMPDLLGSMILIQSPPNWYEVFYIRMDRGGSFYMYLDLGEPFLCVDDADNAIDQYLYELQSGGWCEEHYNFSIVDRMVHNSKYYLDGRTPRRGPNSPNYDEKRYLVQALLDQYNDQHNLFGDLAHELESLVREEWIYENDRRFYHFNFTTKTKEGDDTVNNSYLFFAKVSQHIQGEDAWEVYRCCIINSEDNGHCYGCRNNGTPDMQHPNDIGAYIAGRVDEYLPFGDDEHSASDFEDEEAEEARIRHIYKGLDDPVVLEEIYSYFD
ncbi:hypothetical protein BS78_10G026000 [Paspalum vaginatum]|nr:hypothetical protein BS78_10G026000 [Paspalum vaginatum]